ncbi:alpha-E domain-containing protein [Seongchinamella sediminis]|uniref:Alpha-E domain-containing protein n=1 Tax=Seongchinamella sediminis TaxID=2283635 RepID=A0A3L7DXE6_9GAMM|nr:alpha-E domain-containing protein [Seongchinamella sediminis]RLQ22238.1 alpha-E domain-containing protein [Seongchinamella sediminis]
MRLLSRVAERLYWMARYMERAEDTARLTQSYSHLYMDTPEGAGLGWDLLVDILDGQQVFENRFRVYNEQNVLKFLIADEDNVGSIRQSVKAARENVRTTRDVLPEEVWEHVNELYLYTRENADTSIGRRNRHRFLDQVQARCQIVAGLVLTTMCRDNAFRFMALGHLLERADMTTRVIDVGAGALLGSERSNHAIDPLIWGSLLQSLSAMSTYRRNIGPLPEAGHAVEFIFKDPTLPRSLQFCLNSIRGELKQLKNNDQALKSLERARRRLKRFNPQRASWEELHQFIDDIQLDLYHLGENINQSWFLAETA